MTSSYLKAMQLTKQLEEKAKEEKKNRQLAETEMQEAERMIKSAKASDINVARAEELLVKAGSDIEGKEYKDALSTAIQSKEMAMKCFEDGIQSIIDSVDKLADLTRGAGTSSEQGLSLLQDAKKSLKDKDFERAMNLSKQSWGVYEKAAQEHLSTTYSQAQSMIVLARNVGEDVSTSENLLEEARKSMEKQDYFMALEHLKHCMESVGSGISSQIEALLDEAKGFMLTAKELQTNVAKVVELISKAESEISGSNLEAALSTARLAKSEAEKTLSRGISENLDSMAKQVQEAEKIDVDIDKASEIMAAAKNHHKEGRYSDAIKALNDLSQEIYNSKFQRVLNTISQSRSKFIAARKIGADTTEAMEKLSAAKTSLKDGNFAQALAMAAEADSIVDSIVGEYEGIENTIAALEEQVNVARKFGVQVSNAEASIKSARESMEARDFESVQAYVKQAKAEVSSALYSHATECIEVAELVISAGDRLGANLKDPEALMKQAIDAAKSGNFQKSIELSAESTQKAEDIIKIHVSNTIASVELAIYDAENVDINIVQQLLDSAKAEFAQNAYDKAFEYADKALNMLETSQSAKAREMVLNLNRSITIAREMGCDVASLEAVHQRCEGYLKGRDFSSVLAEAEKALTDARNLQYVAAERMFGEGKLATMEAKKLGIDITDAKEALKRAKTAFSKADFFLTHKESLFAKSTSERQMAFHQKAHDAINQASAIIAEAKKNKVEVKEPMSVLLSAKGMFERFEYENAITEAERAMADTEKFMNLYHAANTLHFAEEALGILKMLSVDCAEIEAISGKLSNMIKAGAQDQAMEAAIEAESKATGLLNSAISSLLSSTVSLLMDARELNLIVAPQEEMLDRARKAYEQKSFKEAADTAIKVKSQIDDIRKLSQRAGMEIKAAQDVLNEGENLHATMSESKKLLERALGELNSSKYKEAIELAGQSAMLSRKTIEKHVSDTVKNFRVSIEKAKLEGINVVAAEKLMDKAMDAFNSRDYKTALSEAMKSEGELEKVGLQQEMAEKAIVTAESKLSEAEKSGVFSKRAKNLTVQAREEMKNGNYVKALELAIQSGDELHNVNDVYTEAIEAINTLSSQIEVAKKISADVSITTKLLVDAQTAKADHDYSTAAEIAKEGSLEAKRLSHSQLTTQLTNAYKYSDLAAQLGLDVSGSASLLAEAKTFMDSGKFIVSHEKIGQTTSDIMGKLKAFFGDHFAQSERSMEHAKAMGADVAASQELLQKAKKAFDEGKFKDAMAMVEKSKAAIDLKKGFEREFIELTYEAEKVISNSKKWGINVKEAQEIFELARTQKEADYQLALSTLKKSIETVKSATAAFRPMVVASSSCNKAQKGEWTECELTLTNKGKALAKDLKITVLGDVSVEGDLKVDAIRGGGGEAKLKVKVKFETPGEIPVMLKVTSTRMMDGMTFEDAHSFNVFVIAPEVKPTPQATVKSTFELVKLATETKCSICMGKVKPGIEIIRCSCGKEYHAMCGKRFGKCAGCGLEFKEKEGEAKEDDIGDLGSAPATPKPAPTAQAPAQAPPAPQPAPVQAPQPQPQQDKQEPGPEEPKKVAKKKVALKF